MLKYFKEKSRRSELESIILQRKAQFEKTPYFQILNNLPSCSKPRFSAIKNVEIGFGESSPGDIEELAKELIPWRKGPIQLFDCEIDAEWRSLLKWERLEVKREDIEGKKVLDIGANNGLYMFKMSEFNPKWVLGIDPVHHYYTQFKFLNHFAQRDNLQYELWGVEHLPLMGTLFDTVFCMGILYHHRSPVDILKNIREALNPGGQLILETQGIPGEGSYCLCPEVSYQKMKNTYFIPTLECVQTWLKKAKFVDITVVSVDKTTPEEQRNTSWCPRPKESLVDFLDESQEKTIEGYPAPLRFIIKAKKRS